VRGFGAANRRLPSAVIAHELAVRCYRDGVNGVAALVNRFDHVVHCFALEICAERREAN
jgi:hypothetical protein